MSQPNLQALCKMLNESGSASFLLKNMKVVRAEKRTNDLFATPKVTAKVVVEEPGVKTIYELECADLNIDNPIKRF